MSKTVTEMLRDVPLFSSLSEKHREIIAKTAKEMTFPAGTPIVREGIGARWASSSSWTGRWRYGRGEGPVAPGGGAVLRGDGGSRWPTPLGGRGRRHPHQVPGPCKLGYQGPHQDPPRACPGDHRRARPSAAPDEHGPLRVAGSAARESLFTPERMKPVVWLGRAAAYQEGDLRVAVEKALDSLGGLEDLIGRGSRVFVKVNHLSPPSPPSGRLSRIRRSPPRFLSSSGISPPPHRGGRPPPFP